MPKILNVFLLTLLPCYLPAQQIIKRFVKSNTFPVAAIHPDSTDFSDLEPIGATIGNAEIVMLGEQSHGDGATFLAKARLIKYLHEEKGFNVLAFESDFFALNHGWKSPGKDSSGLNKLIAGNIYPIWTKAEQLKDFFYSYIPGTYGTSRPLIVSGFDNQLHGQHSIDTLKNYLDNYLKQHNLKFRLSENYRSEFVPFIDSLVTLKPSSNIPKLKRFEQLIDTILSQSVNSDENDFGIMLLHNLKEYSRECQYLHTHFYKAFVIRDRQMAKNLNWLAETRFPGEKIIVWAASGHIMKSMFTAAAEGESPEIIYPLGKFFTDNAQNREKTYVIGFTSETGSFGILGRNIREVSPVHRRGFETWIDKRYDFAFTDFKLFNIRNPGFSEPFPMKGRGHWSTSLPWSQAFDGVFYIRNMFPSDFLKSGGKPVQNN